MTAALGAGGALPRQTAAENPPPGAVPDARRLSDILALIGDDLSRVEREFDAHLGSDVDIIETVGRYIAEGGGKRVRPALFLLCTRLCGYSGDRHILFASVFELIHTATLVHDDIIDGATMRRGRSSVNSRWGSHLTVLLGDYLYLKSMTLALTADDLRIIRVLCDITLTMIEGELMQAERNGSIEVNESEHLEIVRRKTAMLFAGCGRVAAELALVPQEQVRALESYALNLGMAYQIVDDLLDYTATESVLGKPVANDLKEGRLTLPLIYLLEGASPQIRHKVNVLLRGGDHPGGALDEILDLVRRNGALDRARRLANGYALEATRSLQAFPESAAREALQDIARFVTSRDH